MLYGFGPFCQDIPWNWCSILKGTTAEYGHISQPLVQAANCLNLGIGRQLEEGKGRQMDLGIGRRLDLGTGKQLDLVKGRQLGLGKARQLDLVLGP